MRILLLLIVFAMGCGEEFYEVRYPNGELRGIYGKDYYNKKEYEEFKQQALKEWNAKFAWKLPFAKKIYYQNNAPSKAEDWIVSKAKNLKILPDSWKDYYKFKIENNIRYRKHLVLDEWQYTEWYPYQKIVTVYKIHLPKDFPYFEGMHTERYTQRNYITIDSLNKIRKEKCWYIVILNNGKKIRLNFCPNIIEETHWIKIGEQ